MVDWEDIAFKGMNPWVSLELRSREEEIVRRERWHKNPTMDALLPQYLLEVPGIAAAFALAEGYDVSGPVICKRCAMNGVCMKAGLRHMKLCATKEQIIKQELS